MNYVRTVKNARGSGCRGLGGGAATGGDLARHELGAPLNPSMGALPRGPSRRRSSKIAPGIGTFASGMVSFDSVNPDLDLA